MEADRKVGELKTKQEVLDAISSLPPYGNPRLEGQAGKDVKVGDIWWDPVGGLRHDPSWGVQMRKMDK